MDECKKRKLFHPSSVVPLLDEIAYEIFNTFCKRERLFELFRRGRLLSRAKLLHATFQKMGKQ